MMFVFVHVYFSIIEATFLSVLHNSRSPGPTGAHKLAILYHSIIVDVKCIKNHASWTNTRSLTSEMPDHLCVRTRTLVSSRCGPVAIPTDPCH